MIISGTQGAKPVKSITAYQCFIYYLFVLCILIACPSENLSAREKSKRSTEQKNKQEADSGKTLVGGIKDFSEKENFFSRLLRRIIVKDEEQKPALVTPPVPDGKKAMDFSGKIIRKIQVENLDVFGGSVLNPEDSVRSWFQKSANSLHLNTRDWVIKDKLIFAEGQPFRPFYVQESERIIRQSPFIHDVRIVPHAIKNNADSVDVVVYIKDLWSINGSAAYSPSGKKGKISLNDLNFLGLGNEFKGGLSFAPDLTQRWDWEGSYVVNNIKRTFLSAQLFYSSGRDNEKYGIMAGRDFFSPVISWAGAIAQVWNNASYPGLLNSRGLSETIRYNQQDYWLGYAFDLRKFDPEKINQNKFNIAGRIIRTVYSQRPGTDSLNAFQNNTFYLGRIGYSFRTYYQDRYVFGLGKTEDIPLIKMIELLIGQLKSAGTGMPYYGLKAGYSMFSNKLGYTYAGFQTGTFRSKKQWLNRTSLLELLYFSNLKAIGNYGWRHYIGSRYSYSFDPVWPDNVLDINNTGGLRGFSEGELKGNKKLAFNYEADIFIPLRFLGFKLAVITFADFALIGPLGKTLFDSKLYQAYGLGFRIKNENLVFPPFQFMFAFYPNTFQPGGRHFNMFHQSVIFYRFNQFQFSIPSVITPQ